ncbi:hypothetical protein ACGFZP_24920 [Kitasatospora sp. NPDC048239]|uniref:hypothetical protein n=1 Tax=Kitasatospora sp. NPDC048239 TaxID=3364046 RepID=UPI003715CF72
MDSHDRRSPQIDAREAFGLQIGDGNLQINVVGGGLPPTGGLQPTAPADRARRHLYFRIGSSSGTKFDMIPPIADSHPSGALSEFLARLERVGIRQDQVDAIRARAADVAAASPGEQFVAGVFAFAAAVDDVTDELRERSVGDEFDWFILADLIGRIFLIVRAMWPEDPTPEAEPLRAGLFALAERLDVSASVRSGIQDFATMEFPTATLDEFASATIRLQELCNRLL